MILGSPQQRERTPHSRSTQCSWSGTWTCSKEGEKELGSPSFFLPFTLLTCLLGSECEWYFVWQYHQEWQHKVPSLHWECATSNCSSEHCYIPVDGLHFALSHNHFDKWAAAMVCCEWLINSISWLLVTHTATQSCWWTISDPWTSTQHSRVWPSLKSHHRFQVSTFDSLAKGHGKGEGTPGTSCQCGAT